ncbi:MAG: hypothetical protein V1784_06070, partial [bacterium]
VKRHLAPKRVLITLKGHLLVAESDRGVAPGEPITVQVLSIFPRIHLRHVSEDEATQMMPQRPLPLDLQT